MAGPRSFRSAGTRSGALQCRAHGAHRERHEHAAPRALSKRDALLAGSALLSSLAPPVQAIPFFGGGDTKPRAALPPSNKVQDETLAYEFKYPIKTASGRELPMVTSRKPEKYSSAAPLTADARQRIVTELVSLLDGITYTVYVGPATGKLRGAPPESWTAPQVATVVLTDRSGSRNSAGQRVPMAALESSGVLDHGGVPYYVYETSQQGSPTVFDSSRDTYRRALCVTAARRGQGGEPFLYTLVLACPSGAWDEMEGGFQDAIESFRLTQPGRNYVPPDKDPWLFF